MWSNKLLLINLIAAACINVTIVHAEPDGVGCPLVHNGKLLAEVGLFDGPPSERVELIPRDGGWDLDEPGSQILPNFTLGCIYRGSKEVVTVVVPRSARVCEFRNYPKVLCH